MVTAMPFKVTGKATRTCPSHGESFPTLTSLAPWHHRDERGYVVCKSCGFVEDEFSTLTAETTRFQRDFNHYAQQMRETTGFNAPKGGRGVVPDAERGRIKHRAGILYDTEALLSHLRIGGDAQTEALSAVEAYFSGEKRSGQGRYEAHVLAIVEQVCQRLRLNYDEFSLWSAFKRNTHGALTPISPAERARATSRVKDWFDSTYWKGEKK